METVETIKALHDIEDLYTSSGWYSHLGKFISLREGLPAAEESFLQRNVTLLQNYLLAQNKSLPDVLLLEIACFAPGFRSKVEPPLDVLHEKRGGFSESRLQEAAEWIESAQKFIRHFDDYPKDRINRMLRLMNSDDFGFDGDAHRFWSTYSNYVSEIRRYDFFQKRIFAYIRELDTSEVEHVAHYALEVWMVGESHHDIARRLLERLTCLHPDKFPPIHMQMLQAGIDYRNILFRNANLAVSEALVERLSNQVGSKYMNLLLFVWGKDSFVERQFRHWLNQPPAWWEGRFTRYPLEAGWELTHDGQRRKLYYDTCFQLVPTDGGRTTEAATARADTCQWCNQKLENLLDLDLTDARIAFLHIEGTRLRMPCCPWCHTFKTQFFEVDFLGNAQWSHHNESNPPSRIERFEPMPNTLSLATEPRGTYEAVVLEHGQSQVGGYPYWVNDALYPNCPSCNRHMMLIAKVQWMDVDIAEGWSYAYLCAKCKLTAANYDQT
jgi:hypothetical protein